LYQGALFQTQRGVGFGHATDSPGWVLHLGFERGQKHQAEQASAERCCRTVLTRSACSDRECANPEGAEHARTDQIPEQARLPTPSSAEPRWLPMASIRRQTLWCATMAELRMAPRWLPLRSALASTRWAVVWHQPANRQPRCYMAMPTEPLNGCVRPSPDRSQLVQRARLRAHWGGWLPRHAYTQPVWLPVRRVLVES